MTKSETDAVKKSSQRGFAYLGGLLVLLLVVGILGVTVFMSQRRTSTDSRAVDTSQTNYLTNGSFELWGYGLYGFSPAGWYAILASYPSTNNNAVYFSKSTDAHDGSFSFAFNRISDPAILGNRWRVLGTTQSVPFGNYVLSFWLKGGGNIKVVAKTYKKADFSDTPTILLDQDFKPTATWTKITTAPFNFSQDHFNLVIRSYSADAALVDDVRLEKVGSGIISPTPTPVPPSPTPTPSPTVRLTPTPSPATGRSGYEAITFRCATYGGYSSSQRTITSSCQDSSTLLSQAKNYCKGSSETVAGVNVGTVCSVGTVSCPTSYSFSSSCTY